MHQVVLHQWEMSPFCNKARRCLRAKGVQFEVVNYNGLLARKASKLSAAGTLPVLDFDGERIGDSSAIARFLDGRIAANPLYPVDAVERAQAQLWEDWAGQSLYFFEVYFRMLVPTARERALDLICAGRPRWERKLVELHVRSHYPRKLAEQGIARLGAAEIERRFFDHLRMIESSLQQRDFLLGATPCIADHSVAAQLDEVLRTSDLAPRIREHSTIMRWLERLAA